MRVAANLSFLFKDLPFLERFQAAASCGFTGIEIGPELYTHPLETVVSTKAHNGLEIVLINTPKGVACVSGKEADFRSDLKIAIEYALGLNCPRIHVMAGQLSSDSQSDFLIATETYINNIKYAATECSKNGITVVIECISTIPGYFIRSYEHALSLLKKIGQDGVRLQYDFHHAQRTGGNLCQFLNDNIGLIEHIQVSQVPNRHEPDAEGEINFPYVFKYLKELGYEGWLGCEYNPRGNVKDGLNWATEYLS